MDLVSKALKAMNEYICGKSLISNEETMTGLIQCISAMRRGCDEQQEASYWDDWLVNAKTALPKKLYERIIA